MTSRTYDIKLQVSSVNSFVTGNIIVGNSTSTVATIAAIDTANNILKVKLANVQQEFNDGEHIHSNAILTTGTANGILNSTSLPFQANTFSGNVTTASTQISSITPSGFIAEKNSFMQNPIVRLYTLYYPGEWYPPNEAGNPTGPGEGRAWPNDFPIRFAEIVGDLAQDLSYNITYNSTSYIPFPINTTGISQGSDGKINELTLTVFNSDNMISLLVEDPYLTGNNISNSVIATVNGELVHGIDPRTVIQIPSDLGAPGSQEYDLLNQARLQGLLYDANVVNSYGRANASFNKGTTDDVNGTWQRQKLDTRDLLGGVVEIKTTFANFLDYWPEYSLISSVDSLVSSNSLQVLNSLPYRVGDEVKTKNSVPVTIIGLDDDSIILDKPITSTLNLSSINPSGIAFDVSGSNVYVASTNTSSIYQYRLHTSWDITTANLVANVSVASIDSTPRSLTLDPTGGKLYLTGENSSKITQFSLSSHWDISTIAYVANVDIGTATGETTLSGLHIDASGTRLYTTGRTTDKVYSYTLSAAWNLSTATLTSSKAIGAQENNPYSVLLDSTGAYLYIIGTSGDDINRYILSNAWDITTAVFLESTSVKSFDTDPVAASFCAGGYRLYIVGSDTGSVYQLSMSTAYKTSTLAASAITVGEPLYIINSEADPDSYLEDKFKIDQLESLTDYVATFGLVSWLQQFKIVTPRRKYYKNTCQWLYKGPECQYPGPNGGLIPGTRLYANTNPIAANNSIASSAIGDVCSKSYKSCTLRNNAIHYGGFPGVGRSVPRA